MPCSATHSAEAQEASACASWPITSCANTAADAARRAVTLLDVHGARREYRSPPLRRSACLREVAELARPSERRLLGGKRVAIDGRPFLRRGVSRRFSKRRPESAARSSSSSSVGQRAEPEVLPPRRLLLAHGAIREAGREATAPAAPPCARRARAGTPSISRCGQRARPLQRVRWLLARLRRLGGAGRAISFPPRSASARSASSQSRSARAETQSSRLYCSTASRMASIESRRVAQLEGVLDARRFAPASRRPISRSYP